MMSECFKELDADKSGTVDVRELLEAVQMVDMYEPDDSRSMRANIERIMKSHPSVHRAAELEEEVKDARQTHERDSGQPGDDTNGG